MTLRVLLIGVLSGMFGCAGTATTGDGQGAPSCDGGKPATVAGRALCVYRGAITETGFQCPPELPFMYEGANWAMCADVQGLDQKALEEAADAEDGETATPTADAPQETGQTETGQNETGQNETCVDYDQDGVCASEDQDDRDPAIGAAGTEPSGVSEEPAATEPSGVSEGPAAECEDEDGDGSCVEVDPDDTDPSVYGMGFHETADGTVVFVSCFDEGQTDPCVGVDACLLDPAMTAGLDLTCEVEPAPGLDSTYVDHAEMDCTPDESLCWQTLFFCTDDSGAPTPCPNAPPGTRSTTASQTRKSAPIRAFLTCLRTADISEQAEIIRPASML